MGAEKKTVKRKKNKTNVASEKTENIWAMFCHLSTFSGFFIPFGNVIAPLIIWSLQRYDMPLVDDQGKEALNFQISITIYILASFVFVLVLVGIVMIIALVLFAVLVTIIACVKAGEGKEYRYPLNLRIIK